MNKKLLKFLLKNFKTLKQDARKIDLRIYLFIIFLQNQNLNLIQILQCQNKSKLQKKVETGLRMFQ